MENDNALVKKDPDEFCNARTKSGSGYCKQVAGFGTDHLGKGRCKFHGGAVQTGIASPNFKHGKYCRQLPDKLLTSYQESLNDGDLLELADEVALIESFIKESFIEMSKGGVVATNESYLAKIHKVYNSLVSTWEKGSDIGTLLVDLGTLLQCLSDDFAAKKEMLELIEHKRKLIESERKRLSDQQSYMPIADFQKFLVVFNTVLVETVKDADVVSEIKSKITLLINSMRGRGVD